MEAADDNVGVKIVGGGAWRIAGYGVVTVMGVAAMAVISRSIGPADFASFATALSLLTVAMQIADFGLIALGIREFASQTGDERDRNFRAMITIRAALSALCGAGVVLFAILSDYSHDLILGLIAAAIALIPFSAQASYTVPLQTSYRLNVIAAIDVLRQSLSAILMVIVALAAGNVGGIIATNLPVSVIVVIVGALAIARQAPIWPSWDVSAMRALMRDVGIFAVAIGVGAMYPFIAQIVADSVLAPIEAGEFALAFRVFAVLVAGWMIAVGGAFPLLVTSAREDIERMIYAVRRVLQTSLLLGTLGAVGLLTGAAFVVTVIGGHKFEGSTELIALIGLALPATFTLISGNTVLLASGRHRELLTITLGGALLSVILTYFAAEEWGGHGAVAGIIFGEYLIATGYLTVLWQIDRRALPKASWALAVLVCTGAGCAAALLPLPSLACAVIGVAIYFLLGLALRIFPSELTDRVPVVGPRLSGGGEDR